MKIAVLGAAGRMGSMHARHLIELGHNILSYDPPAGMGGGLSQFRADAVVIATPAKQHLADLEWAIEGRGIHVFVEKPLCLIGQCDSAREILKHADEKGLIVATGYNLRFHPRVMQAKQMIESGQFKPLWGSFLLRQKPARPIAHFLEEWASHEMDLALHLLGRDLVDCIQIHRVGNNLMGYMDLMLGHKKTAAVSFIHADAITPEPFRRAFTLVDQNGESFTRDIETNHVQPEHYKAEIQHWIEEIELCRPLGERSTQLATGWDGLAVIEMLEQLTNDSR